MNEGVSIGALGLHEVEVEVVVHDVVVDDLDALDLLADEEPSESGVVVHVLHEGLSVPLLEHSVDADVVVEVLVVVAVDLDVPELPRVELVGVVVLEEDAELPAEGQVERLEVVQQALPLPLAQRGVVDGLAVDVPLHELLGVVVAVEEDLVLVLLRGGLGGALGAATRELVAPPTAAGAAAELVFHLGDELARSVIDAEKTVVERGELVVERTETVVHAADVVLQERPELLRELLGGGLVLHILFHHLRHAPGLGVDVVPDALQRGVLAAAEHLALAAAERDVQRLDFCQELLELLQLDL